MHSTRECCRSSSARGVRPRRLGSQADFAAFVGWAEAAFLVLVGLVLAAAAASGYALAPAPRSRRRFALASTVAALVVVAFTLPLVEFFNACNVCESLVVDAAC